MTLDNSDDIQIHLGSAKTRAVVQEQPWPASGLSTYVASYGDAAVAQLPVYLHVTALEGIEKHALSSPQAEVGGALLGAAYCHEGRTYVQIDDYMPARSTDERRARVTFTHETWRLLNDERETRHPGLSMVGWYHTHPNLGVFLSDDDRFIQRNFFAEQEQVALVIDPVANERAFFHQLNGQLPKLSGFYVFGDVSKSAEIDAAIKRMEEKPPDLIRRSPGPAGQQVSVISKVVFAEPCVNMYYLFPRPLRRLLGIMNAETAPRISIKSMIIWVLLFVLLYQVFLAGRPASTVSSDDVVMHKQYAAAFARAGDYEEAVREYRRYLVCRPSDHVTRADLLSTLMQWSSVQGGGAAVALNAELTTTRELASQAGLRGDYRTAYYLYQDIVPFPQAAMTADESAYMHVFGFLAGLTQASPSLADRKTAKAMFPSVEKALEEANKKNSRAKH